MHDKVNRNDPCPCGSGKKYKKCCLAKDKAPKKLTAKWINAPQKSTQDAQKNLPDLIERTFGNSIPKTPDAPPKPDSEEKDA